MLGWSAQLGNKLLCVALLLSSSPPLDEPAPRPLTSCQRDEPWGLTTTYCHLQRA